ncbi:unnamed protein product [Notodromas monacha]|uniref:asparaginase n=1 Tax=Notodromas monacha TaxID=399045 RepID=A0A7R9BRS7_9CRUS|nr:unnamed protein product [Notodromas monacha]CAG0920491.1 unnamed protein product [Notodromas monacha]
MADKQARNLLTAGQRDKTFYLYRSASSDDGDPDLEPTADGITKSEMKKESRSGNNGAFLKVASPTKTASSGSLAAAIEQAVLAEAEAYDTVDENFVSQISIDPFSVPKILCRNESYEILQQRGSKSNESRVLVLYTGGTIGMIKNEQGVLAPAPRQLEPHIRTYPHLHDAKYAEAFYMRDGDRSKNPKQIFTPLVLPETREAKRVIYTVFEYEPLLDSSNMTMDDYVRIAEDIKTAYHLFDGFLILHGTDTLAYTASALSFMLENLGKSVILTGSQIPLFETLSDGRDNFIGALVMAGNYNIPEVTVFFNHKLLRGNRTTKISTSRFDAFNSNNMRPLATVGIQIHVHYKDIFRPFSIERFKVHPRMSNNVGLLRLFPSMSLATVRSFLQPPIEGVVLQSYGAGNIPSNREDIVEEMRIAIKARNVLIVNISQCHEGAVDASYATGKVLLDAGVIPGADMTPEAALSKLSYVLSKDEWDYDTKREKIMENLRGEMTLYKKTDSKNDLDLIDALSKALRFSSHKEVKQMKSFIFPCLLCMAAKSGDINKIDELLKSGADLSAADYDDRTALHVACCEGNEEMVKYLLKHGASVHKRDRNDRSPLMNAMEFGQINCVKMLLECGADVASNSANILTLGDDISRSAALGSVNSLKAYREGGISLLLKNFAGSTSVHTATLARQREALEYILLTEPKSFEVTDNMGRTAEEMAKDFCYSEIVEIFDKVRKCSHKRNLLSAISSQSPDDS